MRHPKKKKTWPKSWKQPVGGTLTLKGRSFEAEYVVLPVRVEASTPEELDEAVVERMKRGTKSTD